MEPRLRISEAPEFTQAVLPGQKRKRQTWQSQLYFGGNFVFRFVVWGSTVLAR